MNSFSITEMFLPNIFTEIVQLSNSSKFQDFASFIISLTFFPNFGQIALPFGLQIFWASSVPSTSITSFTLSSSFKIFL